MYLTKKGQKNFVVLFTGKKYFEKLKCIAIFMTYYSERMKLKTGCLVVISCKPTKKY